MKFYNAWRQAADQIRYHNLVMYGNATGAIPREDIALCVAPAVPHVRRTREDQYMWALDVINKGLKEGKIC